MEPDEKKDAMSRACHGLLGEMLGTKLWAARCMVCNQGFYARREDRAIAYAREHLARHGGTLAKP